MMKHVFTLVMTINAVNLIQMKSRIGIIIFFIKSFSWLFQIKTLNGVIIYSNIDIFSSTEDTELIYFLLKTLI